MDAFINNTTAAAWVASRHSAYQNKIYNKVTTLSNCTFDDNINTKHAKLIYDRDLKPPIDFTIDSVYFAPIGTRIIADNPELLFQ